MPQSGFGSLAQYPAAVVRRAMGEAAAAGDVRQLEQLLVGSRGAHVQAACGVLTTGAVRGRAAPRLRLHQGLCRASGHGSAINEK